MAERASGRAERDGLARSAILPNPTGRYKDKTDDRRTRTREERRERRRFLSPRCSSGPPSAASRSSAQLERPRSTSCSAPEHRTDAHQASCRPPGARWTPIMSAIRQLLEVPFASCSSLHPLREASLTASLPRKRLARPRNQLWPRPRPPISACNARPANQRAQNISSIYCVQRSASEVFSILFFLLLFYSISFFVFL